MIDKKIDRIFFNLKSNYKIQNRILEAQKSNFYKTYIKPNSYFFYKLLYHEETINFLEIRIIQLKNQLILKLIALQVQESQLQYEQQLSY